MELRVNEPNPFFPYLCKRNKKTMNMSKLTIKPNRSDLVISTIKPTPEGKKEYYVITHERPDIDETVRECYRKLVCKYLEEFIRNNERSDNFLAGLYTTIVEHRSSNFWGFEIMGVTFFESLGQNRKTTFGSISWNGSSIKLQGENSSIEVAYEKEPKNKPDNDHEKDDNNSDTATLEDGDTGTSTSESTTGSFDFGKSLGSLKEKLQGWTGKGSSILGYVLIGALAVIVYLILTQLFTNLS